MYKTFPQFGNYQFNGFVFHMYMHALNSLFQYKPFVEKKDYENGTVVYQGFCMDLLNEFARTLNFT